MYYSVKSVKALDNFNLILVFESGEKKIFDMNPYLEGGIFEELKQIKHFKKVRLSFDSIEWENGADFDPEVLYEKSISIVEKQN